MTTEKSFTRFDVHGDIRHLETALDYDIDQLGVHGDIRHLEICLQFWVQ